MCVFEYSALSKVYCLNSLLMRIKLCSFTLPAGCKVIGLNLEINHTYAGHDVNFCSDLPRRASEIQFALALLQLSPALEKLYIIIL